MNSRNTAFGGGLLLLFGGLVACPSQPTWNGEQMACESNTDCRERFSEGGDVDPADLYCDTAVGFCIHAEGSECDTGDDCPVGAPGQHACDEGSWACNFGQCELTCVGCDVDEDHDGYGEGAGCAGLDCDDTNSNVHSRSLRPCYDGDQTVSITGACRQGHQWCDEGVWAACTGQVIPTTETCNGLDDDCDGTVDEEVPLPACGLGVCANVAGCIDGKLMPCRPGQPVPGGEGTVMNGEDDDCNGAVDDVNNIGTQMPDCIFVAPSGIDAPANDGRDPALPLLTLQDALAKAAPQIIQARESNPEALLSICVAGGSDCPSNPHWYYADATDAPTSMIDGVSIRGSFRSADWSQCAEVTTGLLTEFTQGLIVPDTVQSPTTLSRMVLRRGGPDQTGISINGAHAFTLSEVRIIPAEVSEETSVGMMIKNGAEVRASNLTVHAGAGTLRSIGIKVEASRLELSDSCTPDANSSGCGSCAGHWYGGIHAIDPGVSGLSAVGIELIDAIGTTLDRISVCDNAARHSVGVGVSGSADGVRVRGSNIEAVGALVTSSGISLNCAGGGAPEVAYNPEILARTDGGSVGSASVGVLVGRDCNGVVHSNGRIEGQAGVAETEFVTGVACMGVPEGATAIDPGTASHCQIVGNYEIAAAGRGVSPVTAIGLSCGRGACARIEDNGIRGASESDGAFHSAGLVLLQESGPLVARNRINGGCVDPDRSAALSWSAGIEAVDSGARLENNSILGGNCVGPTLSLSFGILSDVRDSTFELDVNGNTIDGGGYGGASVGVAFSHDPTDPVNRGLYRNNLVRAGRDTYGWAFGTVSSGARPRSSHHNLVWLSHTTQRLAINYSDPSAPIEAGTLAEAQDLFFEGFHVIIGEPQLQRPGSVPLDPHITSGSACENAGTQSGAPPFDIDGERRGDGLIDIGADEL